MDTKIAALAVVIAAGGWWFQNHSSSSSPSSVASPTTATTTAPVSEATSVESKTDGAKAETQAKPKPKAQEPEKTLNATHCKSLGFDSTVLSCMTCDNLLLRLNEVEDPEKGPPLVVTECRGCCQKPGYERFESAVLYAPASAQERDQDLHDFIKRKAPLFPSLEVEYQEGVGAAIEFSNPSTDPERIVRTKVHGWKSEHLVDFMTQRLDDSDNQGGQGLGSTSSTRKIWTAEIQTCSG